MNWEQEAQKHEEQVMVCRLEAELEELAKKTPEEQKQVMIKMGFEFMETPHGTFIFKRNNFMI